ncbi:MAG: porin [Zoogloeaceae bacterium]|nr:porin [Zoogloeaceae bacterium]
MTQFKKTSIALAVAALASGAAFAQSNVTIYGTVDVGFSHFSGGKAFGTETEYVGGTPTGPAYGYKNHVKSKNAINAGQSADSLIGFKGVEDLGNGNKALFVLEAGFQNDTGAQNGNFLAEQAFLGLTGSWGTAIAGRLVAPRHGFLSALDPFSAGTVGSYRNTFNDTDALNIGTPLADVDRVSNAVAYVSPTFSGFNVTAAYATNGIGEENVGNVGDARVYTILPRYTNGPLDVGVVYQQVKLKEVDTKLKQWAIGGAYDFGAAKVSAFYDTFKVSDDAFGLDNLKLKSWMLGVSVPFGKHAVQASFNQSKLSGLGNGSDKARQYALGYTYSLSKRTNFYFAYAAIKNDDGRATSIADATNSTGFGGAYDTRDAAGDGYVGQLTGYYRKGFQFGLKHDF